MVLVVALATIIGHDYTPFLKLQGGKGVNTTIGASLLIAPKPVIISIFIFYIIKIVFKYVSLGSIFIGISLPLSAIMYYGVSNQFYYLLCCGGLIIVRHKANIIRLINGEENVQDY